MEANRAGGDGDARVGIAADATGQRVFGHLVLLRPRRWASALRKSCWQRSSNGEGSRNPAAAPYRVGSSVSTLFSVCRDRTPPLRAPQTPSTTPRVSSDLIIQSSCGASVLLGSFTLRVQASSVTLLSGTIVELVRNTNGAVIGFYEALGYLPEGEVFYEADIPHVAMRSRLMG